MTLRTISMDLMPMFQGTVSVSKQIN